MNNEVFEYIKSFVIDYFRNNHDNEYGYVDEKIDQINKVRNVEEYSGMFILNILHRILRSGILDSSNTDVIEYVIKHDEGIRELFESKMRFDKNYQKLVNRYRKINELSK